MQVNEHGNVDISRGTPAGLQHFPQSRVAVTARALGLVFAPALTGFERRGGKWRPRVEGIVVAVADAPRLADALAARDARATRAAPARQAKARAAKAARVALADDLGVLPDSRTFAAYMAGDIDEDEARRIGRITAARHEGTNYDELLRAGLSREEAREMMEPLRARVVAE